MPAFDPNRLPFYRAEEGVGQKSSMGFYHYAIEAAADEVFLMRSDSQIVYVNQSACNRLGYAYDELVGMRVWEWDPLFSREVWPSFWKDFVGKKHLHFETLHTTKAGDVFPVEIHAHLYEEGDERFLLAFVDDLTEKKEAERKLRDQDLLRKEKELAESANQQKSQFLANMSHEIRSPMSGVNGMLDLLSDSSLTEEQQSMVGIIKHSVTSLLTVVNDILDFSKIEAGTLALETRAVDLHQEVDATVASFRHAAEEKGIELDASIESLQGRMYHVDPARFHQVLTNLIGNALKFTSSGTVGVQVGVTALGDDRHLVEVTVRDTGTGIPEDVLPHLFDRFYQGDSSNTRKHDGAGLGLAICQKLIALMGGRIRVESQVGEGSSFTFSVPMASEQKAGGAPVVGAQAPDEAARAYSGTVLVVEDNGVNQLIARKMLEKRGVSVVVAEHGAEALAILEGEGVDLILMDCQMPQMDGYEVTRRIRSGEVAGQRVPIVAFTASVTHDEMEKGYAAGMDDYLSKPFEERALVRVLAKWLPR